jgi:hypothetical protein
MFKDDITMGIKPRFEICGLDWSGSGQEQEVGNFTYGNKIPRSVVR